ncbi:hypothetical protein L7E55_12660 [Pelotomaculum isophthalicicum JI]|uniref:Uncharacterized protein n=1 Tax=Pelotomaculum isophthalicicum JI TaxID=947010 RepID=A0A9X4H6D8_9FIRM|nr:hypothetical protein [Pelotomaculum isophthalicicum]MDF9409197.1 hypothetical protein [Pelotomaculum isophthalicicum JI]
MKWLLLLIPLAVAYYTCTYGRWALKNGYRRGGVGVFFLAAFVLALAVFALFFKREF